MINSHQSALIPSFAVKALSWKMLVILSHLRLKNSKEANQVQEMIEKLLIYVLPACKAGLEDPDDDVRAVAAEALIPAASSIVTLDDSVLHSIVKLQWDIFLDLDDLSPSTRMTIIINLILLSLFSEEIRVCFGTTDSGDAVALRSLMSQWQNTPPNWGDSNDPCGEEWVGVVCKNSRVTALKLPSMGIKGTLSGDIGQFTKLQSLDLSSNAELGGPLTKNIGNLVLLDTLILSGCSFSGNIPQELGNLPLLSFLALNSNKFTGKIPPSLGQLSNLYWFDIADNQLSGTIPISNDNSPRLDQLLNAKHFHFNKNQLSGTISEKLFSSKMQLIRVLFDANEFTGEIPASVGLVKSIEVLRLDRNSFSGTVPSSISNLTSVNELKLANNKLSGPMHDLTGMNSLNYVDLSNNSFDASEAPSWFSTIQSLVDLVVESGGLHGNIPEIMFSLPGLEQVSLGNNQFNGSINLGDKFSLQLQLVNFQNNSITSFTSSPTYNGTLILVDNPVCNNQLANIVYCKSQQSQRAPYSTSTSNMARKHAHLLKVSTHKAAIVLIHTLVK